MSFAIDLVVARLFPAELVALEDFNDWCCQIRQDLMPAAADLVALLEQAMEAVLPACSQACHPREKCWERFGGEGDSLIKSVASIRSKLARDMMNLDDKAPRFTLEALHKRVLDFGDLGRVRLVGDFPSDVLCLRGKLIKRNLFLDRFRCPKGVKDFVFDPTMRDGLKGHRARQFSVRVPFAGAKDFGFEIQLMTRLQHAWDRRNHPLYEWQREHPDWKRNQKAVELVVNDFACAEALHLVDQQADRNRQELREFIRKELGA